jgi:hypothetical protein
VTGGSDRGPLDDSRDVPVSDLSMAEVLAGAAEDLAGITVRGDEATTAWWAGGQPFAALTGEWAEFRLDPAVARAALRRPSSTTRRSTGPRPGS